MAVERYKVLDGLTIGEKFHAPGSTISAKDIPEESLRWLVPGGHIEPVKASKPRKAAARKTAARKGAKR